MKIVEFSYSEELCPFIEEIRSLVSATEEFNFTKAEKATHLLNIHVEIPEYRDKNEPAIKIIWDDIVKIWNKSYERTTLELDSKLIMIHGTYSFKSADLYGQIININAVIPNL